MSLAHPSFQAPLQNGEIFFSLVLPVQEEDCLFSSAPTRLQQRHLDLLLHARRDLEGRLGGVDEASLLKHGTELRSIYYEARNQLRAQARLPQNSEGQDFVPLRAYYSLGCPLQEALEALVPLSGESSFDALLKNSCENPDSAYPWYRFPILKKGNPLHPEWPNTTIGWAELEADSLRFYANSEERSEGIHDQLMRCLGERALYTGVEDLDPDAYRARMADVPGSRGSEFWTKLKTQQH